MKQSFYERIGESVYREKLPNGLQIYVVPKPGYAKKYAFFAVIADSVLVLCLSRYHTVTTLHIASGCLV